MQTAFPQLPGTYVIHVCLIYVYSYRYVLRPGTGNPYVSYVQLYVHTKRMDLMHATCHASRGRDLVSEFRETARDHGKATVAVDQNQERVSVSSPEVR